MTNTGMTSTAMTNTAIDEHGHDETDLHVWLDPVNAKAMVHEIEEALAAADPATRGL